MKTYVIGDIHGGYRALLQCLERSNFDKEKDTLIQLGDVADGWTEVPECVEELLTIKNLIPIRGNHDDWTYMWMMFRAKTEIWLSQGGKATYEAYVNSHPDLIEKHQKEFFSKQINYYIDDNNRAFVHGGYTNIEGLGKEQSSATYYWDRSLFSTAYTHEVIKSRTKIESNRNKLPIILRPYSEIFIGHTTTKNWGQDTPIHCGNVWNLDTGAGWSGKLTIMDIDTKEYWQSDPVSDLYPEELGRR